MKNSKGGTIRKRISPSTGKISWQVDFGKVNGKRVQISLPTKQEAMKASLEYACNRRAALGEIEQALGDVLTVRRATMKHERRLKQIKASVNERPVELAEQCVVLELPWYSAGVYFLCDADLKILYIGQSKDVPQRISRHRQLQWLAFERVFFIPYEPHELLEAEAHWIKRLNPPHNGVVPLQLRPDLFES